MSGGILLYSALITDIDIKSYNNSLLPHNIFLPRDRPITLAMRKVFQKSIVFNSSFKKGQKINMNMLNFMKPDKGVSAKNFRKILGKSNSVF